MKKILVFFSALFILTLGFQVAQAEDKLKDFAGEAGYETENPATPDAVVSSVVSTALSYIGVISVILFLVAGFMWMTAGGNSDRVDTAKKIIFNTVVGLTIILGSYALVTTILKFGQTSNTAQTNE